MVDPRPRLDRHRRHRLLRGRPLPRGVPRQAVHRQRRHQPHQPRPARVARLDAEGHRAARLPHQRRPLVPAGRHQARPRRRLYVADFYNRIIGHYEVPLTTPAATASAAGSGGSSTGAPTTRSRPPGPGRLDEGRGRASWSSDLGHPNLAVRILAANQLVDRPDRGDPGAAVALRGVARHELQPAERVHGLWVLQRSASWTTRPSRPPRRDDARRGPRPRHAHPRRAPELTGRSASSSSSGLKDADPFVRRAAAEALGLHPDAANIRPLLDLRQSSPPRTRTCVHVVRMALRDQLRPATSWPRLADSP